MEEQELFPAILELFARFRLFDGRSRSRTKTRRSDSAAARQTRGVFNFPLRAVSSSAWLWTRIQF